MLLGYAVMAFTIAVSALSVMQFLGHFRVHKRMFALLLLPMPIFGAGFSMRLYGTGETVDTGFFLTEFSFLLVYIAFTACLVLGQIKYWGHWRAKKAQNNVYTRRIHA